MIMIFRKQEHMTQSSENLSAAHSGEHMLGHGFYNKNSHEQAKANTYGLPLIIEAINRIDLAQIGSEFGIETAIQARGRFQKIFVPLDLASDAYLEKQEQEAVTPVLLFVAKRGICLC